MGDVTAAAVRLRMIEIEAEARARDTFDRVALESDYRRWLTRLLPQHFRNKCFDLQFALHHKQFFEWGWNWQVGDDPACLWIVNRGGNKSTSVAGLAVALGARGQRRYGLVITRTETQGDTHVRRVNSMLLNSNVGQVYAGMAQPRVQQVGSRRQAAAWNRTQMTTDTGWTLQSFSLLASLRGVGIEEYRPDFIWVTDIDDEHDSLGMVETLENALTASVLAAMGADCMVIFDQNLIHRGSVLNRIYTRLSDTLSDRLVIGPVPAVYNPSYERKAERWYVTGGEPSWPGGMGLEECERKLNLWGMSTWQREAQHNIDLPYEDAVYASFSPVHHVITWDEFAAFFAGHDRWQSWKLFDGDGSPRLPAHGHIGMAQDWGNNPRHPCANRWTWWPGEGMPLTDSVFHYREMCWPRFPRVEGDDREGPSPLQVAKAIHEKEVRWHEAERVQFRLASHERPEIVRAYERDLVEAGIEPLGFQQIDTAEAREGILHTQNFLTIIKDELHPFRIHPHSLDPARAEYSDKRYCGICNREHAGTHIVGRPRMYFITARGQGELYIDDSGELRVRSAVNEAGMARTRFEYPNYRKPDTAQGDERKDPPKRDDDIIDTDRAIMGRTGPSLLPLTPAERRRFTLLREFPPERRPVDIVKRSAWDASIIMREHGLKEVEREQERERDAVSGWFSDFDKFNPS